MFERILDRPFTTDQTLQRQIQERIVEDILSGKVSSYHPLPASRVLSKQLGVSRNTVTLVYEQLAQDGYVRAVNRRGYFVNEDIFRDKLDVELTYFSEADDPSKPVNFDAHMVGRLPHQNNITKTANWEEYDFPFIYGQVSTDKVSLQRWRDCIRTAGRDNHAETWSADLVNFDDPLLVHQIQQRILPYKGFRAEPEEILVTVGAQNALFLASSLLCNSQSHVHIENPGYADARNIFAAQGCKIIPHEVDSNGMKMGDFENASLVYTTPGHHAPTNVTMSMERRFALLKAAAQNDFLILEDDYEHEMNFVGAQHPTLKSLDRTERVLHVGSLTKPLFPGLRLGFVAAAAPIIKELRALRRLMYRHPSTLAQRAMAIFLSEGHYDLHIRRQRKKLETRWKKIMFELEEQMPRCKVTMTTGGSGIWMELPQHVRAKLVQERAQNHGVLVEAGDVHFHGDDGPQNYLRLGFGAISTDKIAPGIKILSQIVAEAAAEI